MDKAARLDYIAAIERILQRWHGDHAQLVAALNLAHNRVLERTYVNQRIAWHALTQFSMNIQV